MPFSSENGKWETDRIVQRLFNNKSPFVFGSSSEVRVLDVAVGSGTYSDRYRAAISNRGVKAQWTGIEIWKPYVGKHGLTDKYDCLIVDDARSFVARCAETVDPMRPAYDIAFVGDVLEHMEKVEAETLVQNLLKISRLVLISIPIVHYPQEEWEGNPYEKHVKDDWSHEEVISTWGDYVFHSWNEHDIGGYLLTDSTRTRVLVKDMIRPRIGVYSIGKDEGRLIGRWADYVTSALSDNLIHQVVYVDTGSKDTTVAQVKEVGNFVDVYQVNIIPWRFDEGKNTALALLGEDIDIAVSIDIDEYVTESDWKKLNSHLMETLTRTGRLPERVHHSFKTIWDWEELDAANKSEEASTNTSTHYHDRVHSRFGWKWSLPVHEILEFQHDREPIVNWSPKFMMRQKPLKKEGRSSYMGLLEQSVRERPDVWKSWSFLSQEYLNAGRNDDALAAAENAERAPNADLGFLLHLKSFIYYDPKRCAQAAVDAAHMDKIREYYVYAAERCIQVGDYETAKEMATKARAHEHVTNGYKYNADVWTGSRLTQLENQLTNFYSGKAA
jgi:hypothetical protein